MRTPMLFTVGSGSTSLVSRRRLLGLFSCVALSATFIFVGCDRRTQSPIHSLADLNRPDVIIGGETETVSLRMGHDALPQAQVNSYATPADCYAALQAGKIDAVAYDRPALEYAAAQNDQFIVIPDVVGEGHIAVGAPFKNRELMEKVNEFIKLYKENGVYDDMYNRWVKTLNPKLPDIPMPENPINKGNPLIIGNDPQNIPMSFQEADGSWSGFDTEFVMRLAVHLNMEYRFESLYYDALFPAVETGKLDLAVGNLDKTPERAETMLFSDDYIDCPAGIMVLRSRWQPEGGAATSDAPAAKEATAEPTAEPAVAEPAAVEEPAEAQAEPVAEPAEPAAETEVESDVNVETEPTDSAEEI